MRVAKTKLVIKPSTRSNNRLVKLVYQFNNYEARLRKALEYVPAEECRLWNNLSRPDLPTWVSVGGNVVLLGDAAHAMRPYLAQVS
jgi:2-polyprenyl-6-methoxyphenol hydroxylase-like FAD-dependent oxidoreductase